MRYRYLDDFRRGISVFANFFLRYCGIGYPSMSPSIKNRKFDRQLFYIEAAAKDKFATYWF